ncbi:hypothetical protein FA95DRAFT_1613188 [Auriscalpium vulgare]|uniref:Uncharacterized protein n=1 Tax=Auriscalpium vulgare TaxID=40419 RepID=A0ACB8R3K5_9AGAM|nr:hypothetical protein FA95DRAFT_1613188 [Auriscalpium vulgare]
MFNFIACLRASSSSVDVFDDAQRCIGQEFPPCNESDGGGRANPDQHHHHRRNGCSCSLLSEPTPRAAPGSLPRRVRLDYVRHLLRRLRTPGKKIHIASQLCGQLSDRTKSRAGSLVAGAFVRVQDAVPHALRALASKTAGSENESRRYPAIFQPSQHELLWHVVPRPRYPKRRPGHQHLSQSRQVGRPRSTGTLFVKREDTSHWASLRSSARQTHGDFARAPDIQAVLRRQESRGRGFQAAISR